MKKTYQITEINNIEFKEQGYTIIDDFLSQELHDELLDQLDNTKFEINYQLRHGYYKDLLKSENIKRSTSSIMALTSSNNLNEFSLETSCFLSLLTLKSVLP